MANPFTALANTINEALNKGLQPPPAPPGPALPPTPTPIQPLPSDPNAPNPQSGWVTYCPSTTWELPANSVITVVIKQYDSATGLYNDFFNTVQGTVGGVAMYNNKPMSKLNTADIAHTFTIQSIPDETNPLFVSVPLLGVADNAPTNVTINGNPYPTPNVIQFQFRTGPAGHTYIWHCYVPCGSDNEAPYGFSGPMATTGYMAGTIAVTYY